MGTLQASGIGSGIDVAGLVNQLVAAERAPFENRFNRQKSNLSSMVSAFGKLKSSLAKFEDTLAKLKDASAFQNRSANVSDESLLSASAISTAAAGNYNINVTSLAESHTVVSPGGGTTNYSFASATDSVGEGVIRIEMGTLTGGAYTADAARTVDITIDPTNDSLQGLRDAINDAGIGVSASIVQDGSEYRLALTAEGTGSENVIRVSTQSEVNNPPNLTTDTLGLSRFNFDPENPGGSNMTEAQAGSDAALTINGIDITSSSNTLTQAIGGVTLDLLNTGSSTLKVESNKTETVESVKEFVSAYNELIGTINNLTKFGGQGNESASGPLISDSATFTLNSRIHRIIGDASTAGGALATLTEIGFKSSAEDGTLSLNDSDLDAALSTNFDDVGNLIADYTTKLADVVDVYIGVDGIIGSKTDGLNASLKDLEEQRERFELRMDSVRTRYTRQFNAMDTMMAQMNSTMSYLTQQLATLPKAG